MNTESKSHRRPPARRGGTRVPAARKRLDTDARKQLHELQVHQLELEMQNTELRRVRAELHASLTRYSALYEFAPVGYLTLGLDGSILEVNQFAAALLGIGPTHGQHLRLGSFLAPASRQEFYTFLVSTLHTAVVQECEVEMQKPGGGGFCAQIAATYQAGTETYLVAVSDVSAHRDALRRANESERLAQKLVHQNRSLTRRMFQLLESDRRSIAYEIHDELGRWLAALYAELAAMIRIEHKLRPETRSGMRAIIANLAEMQNGVRRILLRLRPTLLDVAGLAECLREVVQLWKEQYPSVDCEMTFEGEAEGIPDAVNVAVFRIVQESLTNIARHAQAHKLAVRVVRDASELRVSIEDDGDGFDTEAATTGMGLLGMRERVIALDGRFEYQSEPGKGARLQATIPLAPAADTADLRETAPCISGRTLESAA